jgi:hypothetical protein
LIDPTPTRPELDRCACRLRVRCSGILFLQSTSVFRPARWRDTGNHSRLPHLGCTRGSATAPLGAFCDETGLATSFTNTPRSHRMTRFSAPTGW